MDAHVPLVPVVQEGVAAAARLIVLLQHQDPSPGLGEDGARRHPPDAGADDDRVQSVRDLVQAEALLQHGVSLLLVMDVGLPSLPGVY